MPRSGGTYTKPAGTTAVDGEDHTIEQWNNFVDDVADEITASLPRDGSAAMTGNLPMGGNRVTGVGDATAATDAVNRQTGDARYILTSGANVGTANLADNAVTTAKITDANVTTAKLADNAVTTAKITDANVTTAKLADNAVTTAKITDANVTTAKLADGSVTLAKISSEATTWNFVEKVTGTGANLQSTADLSAYDEIRVYAFVIPSANDHLRFQIATAGPAWVTSGYSYRLETLYHDYLTGANGSPQEIGFNQNGIRLNDLSYEVIASGAGWSGEIRISSFRSARDKLLHMEFNYEAPGSEYVQSWGTAGFIDNAPEGVAVRLNWTGGSNFASGSFLLIEGRTI